MKLTILQKSKLIFALLFLIFVTLLINFFDFSVENLQMNLQENLVLAVIVFLLLYGIKSLTMSIPNSVLYVAAGLIFPIWAAILITYIGLSLSALVGYYFGSRMGETRSVRTILMKEKFKKLIDKYEDNLLMMCFVVRLLAIPFGLASMFFGVKKLPKWQFLLITLLGVTPTMLPILLAGSAIANPFAPTVLLPFIISLLLGAISLFLIQKHSRALKYS